ncbi:MAG: gamma carbonic anhydrase family protein [Ignavibacteriales bacterium]|nr:Protein YrdA [Ignavibacteriaceae bacterium]MCZ2142627.1 gamma carbonic anhydrase family protein [Ignavibacteriales bacterium]WKZ73229.1 MAG: gamma carbonic anhydrase family protein [Ignavibacteriaceae bacterium]
MENKNSYSMLYFEGKYPKIAEDVFIADGVRLIGDVTVGKGSSLWYNSVLRGDDNFVKVGEFTNIQDGSILHVTGKEFPCTVGNFVTVGHNANIHACTVEDFTLIGIGAIVLDGALVEKNSIVAAGAVVTPGTVIKSGYMYAGTPAKIIRSLTDKEFAFFEKSAYNYFEIAKYSKKSIADD